MAKDKAQHDNSNGDYILTLVQPDAAGRAFNVAGVPGCEHLAADGDERGGVVRFRRGVAQYVSKPVFEYLKDREEKTFKGHTVKVFRTGEPDEEIAAELPTNKQFEAVRKRQADQDERLDGIDGRLGEIVDLLRSQDTEGTKPAPKPPRRKRSSRNPKAPGK